MRRDMHLGYKFASPTCSASYNIAILDLKNALLIIMVFFTVLPLIKKLLQWQKSNNRFMQYGIHWLYHQMTDKMVELPTEDPAMMSTGRLHKKTPYEKYHNDTHKIE